MNSRKVGPLKPVVAVDWAAASNANSKARTSAATHTIHRQPPLTATADVLEVESVGAVIMFFCPGRPHAHTDLPAIHSLRMMIAN
ncbi:MAG: hypothetical protein HYS64_02840 [Rhodospirillales bacterium]|nr:hypothetical protein [Rhodospirillales bacterium]